PPRAATSSRGWRGCARRCEDEISRSRRLRRPTGMKNHTSRASKSLESRLRRTAPPHAGRLARPRDALAPRADAEGLVDVAFERHASPLGTLLLGATPHGLVRVGLPADGEADVLDELATRISARVLHVAREPLTRARRQLDAYFE